MGEETAPPNTKLSAEETAKIQSELDEFEDEFDDAVEDEAELKDSEGNFGVSTAEMSLLRAELAMEYPEDYDYMSDAYIKSVASKPYSKDPTKRRPIDYTLEKLKHVMEWRETVNASGLVDLVDSIKSGDSTHSAFATSLNNATFYWHGLTKTGNPILWVRTNRRPWFPDVEADMKALILLADTGIRNMPSSVTDFVVIADSTSPPPPHPGFMIELLKALIKGYPDRLHKLVSSPVSGIIQGVMGLLMPLMPGRLAAKIILQDDTTVSQTLTEIIDESEIPTFMGGTANHDVFYPDESKALPENKKGLLTFDWDGMIQRLEAATLKYEQQQNNGGDKGCN